MGCFLLAIDCEDFAELLLFAFFVTSLEFCFSNLALHPEGLTEEGGDAGGVVTKKYFAFLLQRLAKVNGKQELLTTSGISSGEVPS